MYQLGDAVFRAFDRISIIIYINVLAFNDTFRFI